VSDAFSNKKGDGMGWGGDGRCRIGRRGGLNIRNHSMIVLALTLSDDVKQARIRYCYALQVAMFT
jgi:hypothetical protein